MSLCMWCVFQIQNHCLMPMSTGKPGIDMKRTSRKTATNKSEPATSCVIPSELLRGHIAIRLLIQSVTTGETETWRSETTAPETVSAALMPDLRGSHSGSYGFETSESPESKVLKACAEQLSGVYTDIFNASLVKATVLHIFKSSTIIPRIRIIHPNRLHTSGGYTMKSWCSNI